MDAKDARERLMEAATRLLAEKGAEGTSTRAVCEVAGVTQPTLYHHFGDKEGLIEAVVTEGFERALARKKASERETDDPVEDLRRGWDEHVAFGVENPHLYAVMHGKPGARRSLRAAEEASSMLLSLTRGIARTGRLRLEPELAAQVVRAAVYGVTLMLSSSPDFGRLGALNAIVREAIISAITVPGREDVEGDAKEGREVAGIEALRLLGILGTDEAADNAVGNPDEGLLRGFSWAESALLKEWLGRLAADTGSAGTEQKPTEEDRA